MTDSSLMAASHGTRKSSCANAYLRRGNGKIIVRRTFSPRDILAMKRAGKDLNLIQKDFLAQDYFENLKDLNPVAYLKTPFDKLNKTDSFDVILTVKGGGVYAQLDACRLAIAKALVKIDKDYKPQLDKLYRTDPRRKERAKKGQHGCARAKEQYSKR
jgi:small subunit ribosomal protein S9